MKLLCLLLILGTFFLPAFRVDADATNATGTLGVCNIQDPTYHGVYNKNSYSNSEPSAYNRVYFGQVPASNDNSNIYNTAIYHTNALGKPIYWRVLNTHANDINNTPALFMLTEYILTNNLMWDKTSPYGQKWISDSSINTLLNDTADNGSVYNKCFQAQEKKIIIQTQNGETTNYNVNTLTASDLRWVRDSSTPHYAYGCELTGERLFLLSAKEVTNRDYGFMDTTEENYHPNDWNTGYAIYPQDTNRIAKPVASTGNNSFWWLRSAYSYDTDRVAFVNSSGYSHAN